MNKFLLSIMLLCVFCSCKRHTTASNDEQDSLCLVSFNIRYENPGDGIHSWDNRKEACAVMIRQINPDAFGTQEVMPEQQADLERLLPEYAWAGGSTLDPDPRYAESLLIFYRKATFDLIDSNLFWLSETPDSISRGWDARFVRAVNWVHLQNKVTKKHFLLLNTHLDHVGPIARTESTKLIVQKMRQLSGDSIPVFALGDFNAWPEDPLFLPIKEYLADTRMTVAPDDSTSTSNAWGAEPPYKKIIDYIFYKNAQPLEYRVLTEDFGVPYISDHYPITGKFSY
jgi:endonuclease/exonuclease/phosphatase family metal-dependent hydrolase